jgi:hypothetical protein
MSFEITSHNDLAAGGHPFRTIKKERLNSGNRYLDESAESPKQLQPAFANGDVLRS